MASLSLINTEHNGLLLKGEEPGEELEYYDLDGEGGKATKTPITPWNQEENYLGIEYEYDINDEGDSFWTAQDCIVKEAIRKGFEIPEYVVSEWSDEDFKEVDCMTFSEVQDALLEIESGNFKVKNQDLFIKKEENSDERFYGKVTSADFVRTIEIGLVDTKTLNQNTRRRYAGRRKYEYAKIHVR